MRSGVWSALLGVSFVLSAACGGGGSTNAGGAGADFCNAQAKAFCKKTYECTPPAMRDAFFMALAGSSESQCATIWTKSCTEPPSGGTTFDVNCSGGKTVNPAARTRCLDKLASVTCDEYNGPSYDDDCDQVCTTASPDAGAGGDAASGADSGGAATDGPTAGQLAPIEAFCRSVRSITCDKQFECIPAAERDADFTTNFGSTAAECKTKLVASCPTYALNCATADVYSPQSAASCLAAYPAATCAELPVFLGVVLPPDDCLLACFLTEPP